MMYRVTRFDGKGITLEYQGVVPAGLKSTRMYISDGLSDSQLGENLTVHVDTSLFNVGDYVDLYHVAPTTAPIKQHGQEKETVASLRTQSNSSDSAQPDSGLGSGTGRAATAADGDEKAVRNPASKHGRHVQGKLDKQ